MCGSRRGGSVLYRESYGLRILVVDVVGVVSGTLPCQFSVLQTVSHHSVQRFAFRIPLSYQSRYERGVRCVQRFGGGIKIFLGRGMFQCVGFAVIAYGAIGDVC